MRSEVLLCLLMDDVEDRAEDRLAAGAAAVLTPGTDLCRVEDVQRLFERSIADS